VLVGARVDGCRSCEISGLIAWQASNVAGTFCCVHTRTCSLLGDWRGKPYKRSIYYAALGALWRGGL
jgi:hypothetical protein